MAELSAVARPIDRERISETFRPRAAPALARSERRSPPAAPIARRRSAETTKTATGRKDRFRLRARSSAGASGGALQDVLRSPARGWTAEHILLSSGQSAMAAILHALEGSSLFGETRRLSCLHLGSYFETGEIFSLFKSLLVSCAARTKRCGKRGRAGRRHRHRRARVLRRQFRRRGCEPASRRP